jgi:hypothetical protein
MLFKIVYICKKLLHLEQLQTLQLSPYRTISALNSLTVCYISDKTMCAECLASSWRLTAMLHTLQCQFTTQCNPTYINLRYVNDTTTRPTCWASLWATCGWMLQTLQCHFAAQCSPNYITLHYVNDTTTCPTCRVSSWRLTRKAKLSSPRTHLEQRLNPDSSSSGFLKFRLSILSAVFIFFCCCLSVQKLDLCTWSLMCTLCVRTISVCLLRLKFLGNEWA